MKPKHLIGLLVLLNCSCKVTQKSITGIYRSQDVISSSLKINDDNTFSYIENDPIKIITQRKNKDSCFFITKGKWQLIKGELILNSYDSLFSDTGRVRKIVKTQPISNQSNFSFKDVDNNKIFFDRIDDEKGNFAFIVHNTYSNFNVELSKHALLTFYFLNYQPWTFRKKDDRNTDYVITLAPYYKQVYFKNKRFETKRNRLISGKKILKKVKS